MFQLIYPLFNSTLQFRGLWNHGVWYLYAPNVHLEWVVLQVNVANAFNIISCLGSFPRTPNNKWPVDPIIPICSNFLCQVTPFMFESSFSFGKLHIYWFFHTHIYRWLPLCLNPHFLLGNFIFIDSSIPTYIARWSIGKVVFGPNSLLTI